MIAGLETIDAGTLTIDGVRSRAAAAGPAQRRDGVPELRALPAHDGRARTWPSGCATSGVRAGGDPRAGGRGGADAGDGGAAATRRPAELSGGQRQRVAIGRAIVKEPKAFLFDEPLSNLDAALRARTRVELAELHQRLRSTMIYVTHDQVEAMTLADRIVVLNDRRIEQVGHADGGLLPPRLALRRGLRRVAGDELPDGDPVGQRRPDAGAAGRRGAGAAVRHGARQTARRPRRAAGGADRRRPRAARSRARPRWSSGWASGRWSMSGCATGRRSPHRTAAVHRRAWRGRAAEFDTSAVHLFGEDGRAWHAG